MQKDNKYFCMCNFGLIGNGRMHCLDKDECQIGANRICGDHTACHNTYGSFFCICLEGYRASNNNDTFIPNDGTFCTDIDECEVPDLCGYHGQCRNIPGSYECYCMVGFSLRNGREPFQANGDMSLCKAVDCGLPPMLPHSHMGLPGNTTFGTKVTYRCAPGFIADVGHNTSICTAEGKWEGSTLVCTAINCGLPLNLPNSHMDSPSNTTFGSKVTYSCAQGFIAHSGHNTSICTAEGVWEGASLVCKAVDCGLPLALPNAVIDSSSNTTFGNHVRYRCAKGFVAHGGQDTAVCTEGRQWEGGSLMCRAVDCGSPPSILHASSDLQRNTTNGSILVFKCLHGYVIDSGNGIATCNGEGQWEGVDLVCREIDCGPPPAVYNAEIIWNGARNLGSEVQYTCMKGFYNVDPWNLSRCTLNETWENITFMCTEVDCGVPSIIDHADLLWNNQSTLGNSVYYVCKPGFQDNGGKTFSLCTAEAVWEELNLTCTVKSDLISNVSLFNGTCLQWKKSEEILDWKILYEFNIFGTRWHQKDFVHEMTFNFTTDKEFPTVCLDLLQGTNYTVTITAVSPELSEIRINITVQTAIKSDLISNVSLFNGTCLQWKKSEEILDWKILYEFNIFGTRWHQKDFVHEMTFNFTTDKEFPAVCLDLFQGTNYTVTITAVSPELSETRINITVQTAMEEGFGNIAVFNETCLKWTRSFGEAGLLEVYTFFIQGRIPYPEELLQNIMFNFSTDKETPVLCLELPSAAEYLINVTESSTELSAYVHINTSADGNENVGSTKLLNETCLRWNRSVGRDGLQEIYKLSVQGGRWYPKELLHDLQFNISTDQDAPVVCFELPLDKQHAVYVTEAPSRADAQSLVTTAVYGGEPISNLTLLNETCLRWKRQSPLKEVYMFLIHGRRWYQKDFIDELMFNFTTNEAHPVVCLQLHPGTNYTAHLISTSHQHYPAQINIMTRIADPRLPRVVFIAAQGELPRLSLQSIEDKNGPISSYQVFVVHLVSLCTFTCESLEAVTYFSNVSKTLGYITAEFLPNDITEPLEFSLGDRQYYRDFYNAPLARGKDYCIILRIVSKWNKMSAYSCMVLAEIKDVSPHRHHMDMVLLGSVAFVCFVVFMSYSTARCCKRW
ncbi:sushi domain-containing protein 1 isoform X2 [Ascaphus truei]